MTLSEQCKAQKLKRRAEKKRRAKTRKALQEKVYRRDKMISTMRERLASEKSKRLAVINAINGIIDGGHVSFRGQELLMMELHKG